MIIEIIKEIIKELYECILLELYPINFIKYAYKKLGVNIPAETSL